jgi:hypothetical protein
MVYRLTFWGGDVPMIPLADVAVLVVEHAASAGVCPLEGGPASLQLAQLPPQDGK